MKLAASNSATCISKQWVDDCAFQKTVDVRHKCKIYGRWVITVRKVSGRIYDLGERKSMHEVRDKRVQMA